MKQVKSRCEELLKELSSLDDQKKEVSYQVVTRKDLLQDFKWEVIDLLGRIDTINGVEVVEPATKASLENTEAHVKESFEDLKTF